MSAADIFKILSGHDGIFYRPYSPTDVVVSVGAPPDKLTAWDYVLAYHKHPQKKVFQSLGGGGCSVNNINTSGIIEVGILQSSTDCGLLDLLDQIGIPMPIICVDKGTGGTSGFTTLGASRVDTPKWRRALKAGVIQFTFETNALQIDWGVQLLEQIL